MELTPDEIVYWSWAGLEFNATVVFTWGVNLLIAGAAWALTRGLSDETSIDRGQHILEVLVLQVRDQIRDIVQEDPRPYLPFVATLFLFISVSNALTIVPYYQPPTASLSTTVALALAVFLAVPVFGIRQSGWRGYLRHYVEPSPLMLPFNVIGELSRTIALAVRLFGNIMSGTLIVAILVALTPILFPIVMRAFGLLTGLIQAYIFAVLATVYIASGMHTAAPSAPSSDPQEEPR
jgi:F-type H+-transporting ATPase subunit a